MPPCPALRPARRADAPALARLADVAGDGLPAWWWAQIAPGVDPFETGAARAARDDGPFSWRNAVVAETAGAVAACVIGHPLDPAPGPSAPAHPAFAPLDALEAEAGSCYYVNFLAVAEGWRGRGVGARLLEAAETRAAAAGRDRIALIVAEDNAAARRFYAREGFSRIAARPVVDRGRGHGGRWLLMLRPVEASAARSAAA